MAEPAQDRTDRTKHETTPELEALRADLDHLRKDVTDLLRSVKRGAKNRVRAAREDLEDGAERLSTRLQNALESAANSQAVTTLERQVSDHPATTLLVAFGLGWVLGRFVRR